MYNIKDMVKDGKRVKFLHYKLSELWYQTEDGFSFPVPIADTGDGIFHSDEKAILLMRYIRKHVDMLTAAQKAMGDFPGGPLEYPEDFNRVD